MLEHPHIVHTIEILEDPLAVYIVQELMTDGDLIDFLDKVKNESLAYTEADAASIVHQLLMAVNYIHSTGIAHRDLKLDNILVKLGPQRSDSFSLP